MTAETLEDILIAEYNQSLMGIEVNVGNGKNLFENIYTYGYEMFLSGFEKGMLVFANEKKKPQIGAIKNNNNYSIA